MQTTTPTPAHPPAPPLSPAELAWLDGYAAGREDADKITQRTQGGRA